ncbi:MAG: hypothetical protein J6Y94_07865, partial [Bacteriovoracaceae bacterium]|nr:hypothetical protein [Bacteriovoracaceae bacterium]
MKTWIMIFSLGLFPLITMAAEDGVATQAERMAHLREIFTNLEEQESEITLEEKANLIPLITEVGKDYLEHSATKFSTEKDGVFKLELKGNRYFNALASKLADLTSVTDIKIAPAKMHNLQSWFAYNPKENAILIGPKAFIDDVPDNAISDLVVVVIQDKAQKINANYKLDLAAFTNLYDFSAATKYLFKLKSRKNPNLNFKNQIDRQFLSNYLMVSAYSLLQEQNGTISSSSSLDPIVMDTAGEPGKGFIEFAGKAKSQRFLNLLTNQLLDDEDLDIEQVVYDPQNLQDYYTDGEYDASTKTYRLGHKQILTALDDAKNARKLTNLVSK